MDSETLKLSIIIPAYNASAYIEKCIRSCENQDLDKTEYEIIVVDDGSTDCTKEYVQKLRIEFPNIVYIYQKNARQGAARNNGLKNARGKYIWYVDADDWIESNVLASIIDRIEKNELTALLVGHLKLYKEKKIHWHRLNDSLVLTGKEVLRANKIYNSPTYGVWNRQYLVGNKVYFVEKIFHEDAEIYPRMYYNASKIGFWSKDCYYVFLSSDSTTRSANVQRAIDVVDVVKRLSIFYNNVKEQSLRHSINQYICSTINMSLYNIYILDKKHVKRLDQTWEENCDLFVHLRNSKLLKYKIEGFLFALFKRHVSTIYRLLQLLNSNPGIGKIENLD